MSVLTGPLFSLEASKSLKKTIVYQRRVGRPTAYLHTNPYDPKSAAQMALRGYMTAARDAWTAMSEDYHAQWNSWQSQYCAFP